MNMRHLLGVSSASFLSFVALAVPLRAQCADWQDGFGLTGSNGEVWATCVFDDGSGPAIYVAGSFTNIGGVAASCIAKWDGTDWTPLGQGLGGGQAYALTVFDDGSGPALFVAGSFSLAGGVGVGRIAKWNGVQWAPFPFGFDSNAFALGVFDLGSGPRLVAGGSFVHAGAPVTRGVAQWDGSSWSPLGSGIPGIVYALASFDDGSGPALHVAGSFTTAGGVSAMHVAKFDGSTWSPLGNGLNAAARSLATLDDGPGGSGPVLYVGGYFNSASGAFANSVARWNGSSWSGLGSGLDQAALALAAYDDGSGPALYAGGFFATAGGVAANRIAKWNGSAWSGVGGLSGDTPAIFGLYADTSVSPAVLYATGKFAAAGNVVGNGLATWNGTQWGSLGGGAGLNETIWTLTVFDDGTGPAVYAGGLFTSAGAVGANRVARWDGTSWSALGTGVDNGLVYSSCVFDDGSGPALYFGGSFLSIGGANMGAIARWNGSTWSPLAGGMNGSVTALAVFDDGSGPQLYAGGSFTSAGSVHAQNIARWDGANWSPLGTGTSNQVHALCVFDDGPGGNGPALYAGGVFASAGGTLVNDIARWDGSSWSGLNGGLRGMTGYAYALTVFDDGSGPSLFVGGSFTLAGGTDVHNLARWDGANWYDVGGGADYTIQALTPYDDGSGPALCVGGYFDTVGGGQEIARLARWNGSTWSGFGAGVSAGVRTLCVFDNGAQGTPDLCVGGYFHTAGGALSEHFGIWRGCGAPGERVCAGDGSGAACPCSNDGVAGHGCENSASTGGAILDSSGWTSLAHDSLVLTSSGELPSVLSIFLQGTTEITSVSFGDGLRCAGGQLKRLYTKNASAGTVSAPALGDLSISARSAQLGDAIATGTTRIYQVYYRDPNLAFCPSPAGNSWNVSSGLRIAWEQ